MYEPVAWVGPAGMSVRVRVCECARAMSVRMVRGGHVDARARRRSGAVSVVLREPVAWVGPAGMLVRVRVCECAMAMCARWQCRCACVAMQWRGVDGVARARRVGGPGGGVGARVCVRVREGNVDARAWRRSGAVSMVLLEPVGPARMSVRVRVCECVRAVSISVGTS